MRKTKVLHLITHLGFGGASDNTLLTVKDLSRARYEVHLGAGTEYVDWVEQGQEYADAFILFPNLYRSPRPLADLRLLWQLTRFLRAQRYDIVHTHNAKAGVIGRLAAYLAGVPIILHSMHLLSWQDMEADRSGWWPQLKAALQGRIYFGAEKFAAALSDMVITVSQLNREEAATAGLAPRHKLATVYSGIEYDRFRVVVDKAEKCRALGLSPTQPIVGIIGRLSPQKAPLDFVAAAKAVLAQRPDVQFLMVGDGPLSQEVHAAIGAETRIKLLGYRDDVPELLAILDIFALSSLWEGLGRALTEAMSVGIAVAATAVNGIPEIVHHGETGLLSPPAEPQQLAKNILWLLNHPQEAAAISRRGQEQVLPHFGAQQMIDQIEAIYETLLAKKGRVVAGSGPEPLLHTPMQSPTETPSHAEALSPTAGERQRQKEQFNA
jgi:glycosyltransferase involved in cell wall biosynthesis